jgi:hypothetical protein
MSISPVSSQAPMAAPQKTNPVESGESVKAGKEVRNDGDADDSGNNTSKAATPPPTTNSMGEVIGQHVNTKA